jgi:hypothetical protein
MNKQFKFTFILLALYVIIVLTTTSFLTQSEIFLAPECGNEICEIEENSFSCPIDCKLILTTWGEWADSGVLTDQQWTEYVEFNKELRDLGFTHAGFHIYRTSPDQIQIQQTQQRISQLKEELNVSLHISSGHIFLEEADQNDPENHSQPPFNPNLKYFNASFNPYGCISSECNASANPPIASRRAIDPAYDGIIWQKELNVVVNYTNWSNITENDIVLFDTEVWGKHPSWVEAGGYYPGIIQNSQGRYSGTQEERYTQYIEYWRQRGNDLQSKVHEFSPNTPVLFYGEQIARLPQSTWMPVGTGFAPSPSMYYAPNLSYLNISLDYYQPYNGSYPWISFSTVQKNIISGNLSGATCTTSYCDVRMDPKVTQKMGYMFRQANVNGLVIYPGPRHTSYEYFKEQSEALKRGFIDGIDIPNLIEICADGMDNDGDGAFDERQCISGRPECSDGIDNDIDNKTDYPNDPGCESPEDNSEYSDSESWWKEKGIFNLGAYVNPAYPIENYTAAIEKAATYGFTVVQTYQNLYTNDLIILNKSNTAGAALRKYKMKMLVNFWGGAPGVLRNNINPTDISISLIAECGNICMWDAWKFNSLGDTSGSGNGYFINDSNKTIWLDEECIKYDNYTLDEGYFSRTSHIKCDA